MQGGSLYTLEGVPVASHNDTDLKIGWGGERKSPVPGLWGAYWAYLHRPFNGPSPGFQFLPALAIPTAAYQSLLATMNVSKTPPLGLRVLGGANTAIAGFAGTSVDNDWRQGAGPGGAGGTCMNCAGNDSEGTQTVTLGENLPLCPDGMPARVPGGAASFHIPPGGCIKACPDGRGGYTYEQIPPGEGHCVNARGCCPVTAYCNGCAIPACSSASGTSWSSSARKKCCATGGNGGGNGPGGDGGPGGKGGNPDGGGCGPLIMQAVYIDCTEEQRRILADALKQACSAVGSRNCLTAGNQSGLRQCMCRLCNKPVTFVCKQPPLRFGAPYCGVWFDGRIYCHPDAIGGSCMGATIFHEMIHYCTGGVWGWLANPCVSERKSYGCESLCFPTCQPAGQEMPGYAGCNPGCKVSPDDCKDCRYGLCPCGEPPAEMPGGSGRPPPVF